MEGKPVIPPIDPDTLSYEYKMMALKTINFIKENRNRKIKGNICADGS